MSHRGAPPYPAERGWQSDPPRVVCCGGEGTPDALLAKLNACLASGGPFGVLVLEQTTHSEMLRTASQAIGHDRLAAACVGWAVVVTHAAVRPALLAYGTEHGGEADVPFPIHACADRVEAMAWLCRRLSA